LEEGKVEEVELREVKFWDQNLCFVLSFLFELPKK
jgi:hypothetical protein